MPHKNQILLTVLTCFLMSVKCMAQKESINTDRPDQSDGVQTVDKHAIQLENGITVARQTFVNNFMLRYGLTNTTEVRMLLDAGKVDGNSGLQPVALSMKQRLMEQQKAIPAITFVGYATFERLASKNFQGDQVSVELKLAFENAISDKISLGYNLGSSNNFDNFNLSTGLSYAPTDKLSFYGEYFSVMGSAQPEHNLDYGVLYLLTPKLQIDAAVGHSIFALDNRFFTTFGISYLFN